MAFLSGPLVPTFPQCCQTPKQNVATEIVGDRRAMPYPLHGILGTLHTLHRARVSEQGKLSGLEICCHSGYVGARCEHADLLAVVAASQKKQAITALVVVSIVALAVLIITCVLIHCCHVRKHCEWCRALVCRHEKPSALLKGRTACCHSETGTGRLVQGGFHPFLPGEVLPGGENGPHFPSFHRGAETKQEGSEGLFSPPTPDRGTGHGFG
ncbi:Protransforming growth factor alpha [Cricetulus griseus]|uniref:Protransforming growth factor alpha n=1 Tax=Cricetulus griseus TaxID=10029 RepID=G3I6E7_CRIGR|nr:Protransforming growth factor alpha [Cricetulus griseus]